MNIFMWRRKEQSATQARRQRRSLYCTNIYSIAHNFVTQEQAHSHKRTHDRNNHKNKCRFVLDDDSSFSLVQLYLHLPPPTSLLVDHSHPPSPIITNKKQLIREAYKTTLSISQTALALPIICSQSHTSPTS